MTSSFNANNAFEDAGRERLDIPLVSRLERFHQVASRLGRSLPALTLALVVSHLERFWVASRLGRFLLALTLALVVSRPEGSTGWLPAWVVPSGFDPGFGGFHLERFHQVASRLAVPSWL